MKTTGTRAAPHLSRRDFLKAVTHFMFWLGGLLGLLGLVRFFSYKPAPETPSEYDLGALSAYPPGSRTIRPDIPAVIFNEQGEITAISLVCTHLGCTVEENGTGFSCPCHGSRYDQAGLAINGPAQKPLKVLRVEIIEGKTARLHMD